MASIFEEAVKGIHGAWRVLRRDPAAPSWFNFSHEGFWRSFFAALLLLPLYVAYRGFVGPPAGAEEVAGAERWIVELIAYSLDWTLWPLVAFYLTRALDCGDRFIEYAVAYNWAQMLVWPPVIALALMLRGGGEVAVIMILIVQGMIFAYEWLIAWTMLGTSPGKALLVQLAAYVLAELRGDARTLVLTGGAGLF